MKRIDNDSDAPIAHSANDRGEVHYLPDHLEGTVDRAVCFARPFGGEMWLEPSARWHDLGKLDPRFQKKVSTSGAEGREAHVEMGGRVNHSIAGALHAVERFGVLGRVIAYLIAGHHTGLPDWHPSSEVTGTPLSNRLHDEEGAARKAIALAPPSMLQGDAPPFKVPGDQKGFHLWVRMLFSCLVDADFLDTEAHFSPDKPTLRGDYPDLEALGKAYDRYMATEVPNDGSNDVLRARAELLRQCLARGEEASGIFTLTAPTGSGKTLASLGFALRHALRHDKRRIIYALPFTSIIDQTAKTFRKVFASFPDAVIEHHSNLDPEKETARSRLASENWDAPIIVTTNVQLFESLFASRTSRCRKLHNLVDSVVILDEAQMMEPEFLNPIIDVINLLAVHYRVTFVLSTATQPAITEPAVDSFDKPRRPGLSEAREIVDDPDRLFAPLSGRVEVIPPEDFSVRRTWEDVAAEMAACPTALAIVNRRDDCRTLWSLMPEGTLHLSGLMCGAHRAAVIENIKQRLIDKIPTRVVSTQLVEAGVDFDFPVVFRALAGLDSIAQAAGRCNREGRLRTKGRLVVFVPPKGAPKGLLRFGEQATRAVWSDTDRTLERRLFTSYFDHFYGYVDTDRHGIADLLQKNVDDGLDVSFRTVASRFRLIDDVTVPVLISYDNTATSLIKTLEHKGPDRQLLRRLQRYTVNVYPHTLSRHAHLFKEVEERVYILISSAAYDSVTGLALHEEEKADPFPPSEQVK